MAACRRSAARNADAGSAATLPRWPNAAKPLDDLARAPDRRGTLAIATYGVHEMFNIVGAGNMTVLQGVMIFFFAITLCWIAFAVASADCRPPAAAAAPPHRNRCDGLTALLMPVYNEDPIRTTAALQAMAEALHAAVQHSIFEIAIISDSTHANAWIAESLAVDRAAPRPRWRHARALSPALAQHRAQGRQRR